MNESISAQDLEEKDQDGVTEAEDFWSYEVPRPWLTVEEAAMMLGRSVRGVERSIIGRWGNKLPEGWQSRRLRIDGKDEWRIVPPPGFRVKHSKKLDPATREALAQLEHERAADQAARAEGQSGPSETNASATDALEQAFAAHDSEYDYLNEGNDVSSKTADGQTGFSFEKLFQSASQIAQKELASLGLNVKNQLMVDNQAHGSAMDIEHTIVIDRSDEVEKLLRELANVQKELSEERRQHMEDMRLMSQMQNNMRLLEVNATQTSELKEDLRLAQTLLNEHKKQYQAYLALPWWKKIFKSQP